MLLGFVGRVIIVRYTTQSEYENLFFSTHYNKYLRHNIHPWTSRRHYKIHRVFQKEEEKVFKSEDKINLGDS